MAAAIVSASSAAAGFDKRMSSASSLQTPGSGTFPSEMLSPMAPSPGFMRREDALKTPITPPSAYLDFLRTMSPAIVSPGASTSTSARFSFNDRSFDKPFPEGIRRPSITPPTSQPVLSRNASYDSNSSSGSEQSAASKISAAANTHTRPESPRIVIPPSPFAKPGPRSARTPRLRIPQSPFSPALTSAKSVSSPYSTTPMSSAPWSATFSPRENSNLDAASQPGKVSIRHVVTRTVTYCRTPLEPAPKGKRRKIERDSAADDNNNNSKAATPEPLIKHEKIEELDEESASDSSCSSTSASSPPAAETL